MAIPALIRYSFSQAPAVTTLTAVTAVLAGAAPVGITIAIGELVDGLTSAIGHGPGTLAARECYRWVAVIVVLFFLTHLADSATIGHLEDPAYLSRLARARGDGTIDMPPGEAVFGFSTKASMWVTSIGSAALLTWVTWGLGLVAFAVFVVIHSRLVRNYRIAVVETVNQTEKLRRTSYLRDVPTTPGAAREVRVFGLAAFFRDAYQSQWRPNMTEVWQRRREHRLFVVVVVVVTAVTVASVFCYLGYRAATGRTTVGDLAVGGLAVRALLQVLRADDDDLRMGFGSKAAAEALAFPVVPVPVVPVPSGPGTDPWPAVATISCEDLRFRYGGAAGEVLHGIDLAIPAGQSLAIVGLGGAGKTTLARLIAGLDAPGGGCVRVGGIPVEDANRRSWQRQVAAVFQDFSRYELPVRDNIAFGSLAHADDSDGLRAVARQAGLLKFIEGLPDGWDTVLSSGFPGGVDASGGEWQRIAIARALFGLRHGARLRRTRSGVRPCGAPRRGPGWPLTCSRSPPRPRPAARPACSDWRASWRAGTARSGTALAGTSPGLTGGPGYRSRWRGCSSCWRTRPPSPPWCGPAWPAMPRWASSSRPSPSPASSPGRVSASGTGTAISPR
jgi:ATP-binding cassette subfamily B protein